MKIKAFGIYLPTALALLCMFTSSLVAQQPRNRPAATSAPVNNLKIKYKTNAGGQASESATLIRGARERSETQLGAGMAMISITQCDLKRTVQLSDTARKYVITPMETGVSVTAGSTEKATDGPSTRGGVVNYVTTSVDTGERREMFGFKARHVKTTMTMKSSPDACSPVDQRIERDGWYIDFSYGLTCDINRSQMMGSPASGGCQDRYQFKQVGAGRDGYPLIETTTMYGPDGKAMFTSSKEVVELSREPLDPALFDIPAGYTETSNQQELYMPSTSYVEPSESSRPADIQSPANGAFQVDANWADKANVIRVGVVQKTRQALARRSIRTRLWLEPRC